MRVIEIDRKKCRLESRLSSFTMKMMNIHRCINAEQITSVRRARFNLQMNNRCCLYVLEKQTYRCKGRFIKRGQHGQITIPMWRHANTLEFFCSRHLSDAVDQDNPSGRKVNAKCIGAFGILADQLEDSFTWNRYENECYFKVVLSYWYHVNSGERLVWLSYIKMGWSYEDFKSGHEWGCNIANVSKHGLIWIYNELLDVRIFFVPTFQTVSRIRLENVY